MKTLMSSMTIASLSRRAVVAAKLLALGALLGGCAVGPDYREPELPAVASYVRADEQAADGELSQHMLPTSVVPQEWWRLFRSDEINELVDQATRKNKTLVAATASLAQARELVAAQTGTRLPQVGFNVSTGRQQYGAQFLGPIPPPPALSDWFPVTVLLDSISVPKL